MQGGVGMKTIILLGILVLNFFLHVKTMAREMYWFVYVATILLDSLEIYFLINYYYGLFVSILMANLVFNETLTYLFMKLKDKNMVTISTFWVMKFVNIIIIIFGFYKLMSINQ